MRESSAGWTNERSSEGGGANALMDGRFQRSAGQPDDG